MKNDWRIAAITLQRFVWRWPGWEFNT